MSKYTVNICEDTGKPALYRVTEYGGGKALILIAHEKDFFDIHKTLADHATNTHQTHYAVGDE